MTLPSLATPSEASAATYWADFTRPWNHFNIERPTCFISKTVTNMSIALCFNCMWWFPTCPEVQSISKCRTFSTNMKTKHEIVSVFQEHFELLCGKNKNPWVMVTSKNKSSLLLLLLLDILPRSHPLSISPFYFDSFRSQCFSMGIHLQTKKQSTAKYQSIFLENFLWVTGPMVQCHKVQFLSIISWILLIFSDSSDSVSSTAIQSTCRRRSLARSLIASAAISAKHRASALCEGTSQIMRHRGSIEIDNFCTINLWKHIA